MAVSDNGRKNTLSEACFRTISHPLSNLIYIVLAVLIAAFAGMSTGVPTYILVPIVFLLVLITDPPELIAKTRAREMDGSSLIGQISSAVDWQASGNGWRLKFTSEARQTARNSSAERRRGKRSQVRGG
ncbi:hypothetical protein M728_004835 (plasmid) [Ensifer sp. WSM1721]|uniref:hypothetical protein n=1 Tax=Ensifer sp. WSM1721 TaxID=1041159 RepID=UPI000479B4FC|nr:hypothetical protein [Ensifer sp. WSM1721]